MLSSLGAKLNSFVHSDAVAAILVAGVVFGAILGGFAWSNAVRFRNSGWHMPSEWEANFRLRDFFFLGSGLCFLALGLILFSVCP